MAIRKKNPNTTRRNRISSPVKLEFPKNKTDIDRYLDKISAEPGEKAVVRVNGQDVQQPVYIIPRSYTRLNPKNGRFRTGRKRLVKLRREAGIKNSTEFNMEDDRQPDSNYNKETFYDKKDGTEDEPMGGDINQVRNMIKGIHPFNKKRHNKYQQLTQAIKKSVDNPNTPKNGIRDVSIILADGTYVNGNRRDCVQEDLGGKNKKPKFQMVKVVICPPETTRKDVLQMEMGEQESAELREKFENIDAAENLWELYEDDCRENYDGKLKEKDPKTRKMIWRPDVIEGNMETVEGRDNLEFGTLLLNLYEISKIILKNLAGGGVQADDLWRLSEKDPGVSVATTEQTEEWGDEYYKAKTKSVKQDVINDAIWGTAERWHDEKLAGEERELKKNLKYTYQSVRKGPMPQTLKKRPIKKEWYRNHNPKNEKHLMEYDEKLNDAINKKGDRDAIDKPKNLLGEIESKAGAIKLGLEDSELGVKSALVLKQNNAIERINELEGSFTWIKKTIKTKAGKQKKKPKNKPKKKGKKKGGAKKKKPPKRKKKW